MRRVTILLAMVSALLAFAAHGATAPSPGAQRALIADAFWHEHHAWGLLKWPNPKPETARLRLSRALNVLRDVRPHVSDAHAAAALDKAIAGDIKAIAALNARHGLIAREWIFFAFFHKAVALDRLRKVAPGASECSDRRDNDGDGLVDGAFDSGCSSANDTTERSALACTVGTTTKGRDATVSGTCSGPFGRLRLELDAGQAFDPARAPTVAGAVGCGYVSERRLECIFGEARRNPGHRLRLRFRLRTQPPVRSRLRITDFGNRRFTIRRRPAASPTPPSTAFQLGTYATYAHGTGSSNVCVFVWTVPGQSPLRGGVTLTGPSGRQTKAFTTLGGVRRTRVVFTVTERAHYVADVVLAGKTGRAAVSLGLAPTTSGEYACPAP